MFLRDVGSYLGQLIRARRHDRSHVTERDYYCHSLNDLSELRTATAMHSASAPYHCPSTPLAPRNPLSYKPLNSSPLTSSDWYNSSPVAAAQAQRDRRRSQYKTLTPNTPTRSFSNSRKSSGRLFTDGGGYYIATPPPRPDSQKLSLRNRFKARCFERAVKAREKAIKGKRYANQSGSDDFIMDYDDEDEDDDEDIMQDEVCVFYLNFIQILSKSGG